MTGLNLMSWVGSVVETSMARPFWGDSTWLVWVERKAGSFPVPVALPLLWKAASLPWGVCRLVPTVLSVLCLDYQAKKIHCNLGIMMRMKSREYTVTQS